MRIEVRRDRTRETSRSVGGRLFVDGQFECFTLEPARRNPVHDGHPCVAAGAFVCELTPSPHLGYITPEAVGVPGRSHIRVHVGNRPEDLLGCVAVGDGYSTDWVSKSREAFARLMVLLRTSEEGWTIEWTEEKAEGQ